jgi:acyl dehydratase
MFYGDGTLAFAYNGLLARLGLSVSTARLESADAKFTARLFIGDRMRVCFETMEIVPTENDAGTIQTLLKVENQDGEVAMTLQVSLVLLPAAMGVPVA